MFLVYYSGKSLACPCMVQGLPLGMEALGSASSHKQQRINEPRSPILAPLQEVVYKASNCLTLHFQGGYEENSHPQGKALRVTYVAATAPQTPLLCIFQCFLYFWL